MAVDQKPAVTQLSYRNLQNILSKKVNYNIIRPYKIKLMAFTVMDLLNTLLQLLLKYIHKLKAPGPR